MGIYECCKNSQLCDKLLLKIITYLNKIAKKTDFTEKSITELKIFANFQHQDTLIEFVCCRAIKYRRRKKFRSVLACVNKIADFAGRSANYVCFDNLDFVRMHVEKFGLFGSGIKISFPSHRDNSCQLHNSF